MFNWLCLCRKAAINNTFSNINCIGSYRWGGHEREDISFWRASACAKQIFLEGNINDFNRN